jgi:hypothetical protein
MLTITSGRNTLKAAWLTAVLACVVIGTFAIAQQNRGIEQRGAPGAPERIGNQNSEIGSQNGDNGPQEPGMNEKQKRDLVKYHFEQMKQQATELAALAKSLQEDVANSNENIMSLKIAERADKIEKLARKIKSTSRGM